MAGFEKPTFTSTFAIPEEFEPVVIMAIGSKAEANADTDPALLERETAPRSRVALSDLIIGGSI